MTKKLKVLLVLFSAGLLVLQSGLASAFSFPERLVFDLTWTGIKAGSATLEARDNGDSLQFSSRAVSADWISAFYPVEDTAVSRLKKNDGDAAGTGFAGVPYNYRLKASEGRNKKDREIIFEPEAKKATYIDHKSGERMSEELSRPTFDPLSAFYFVRSLPLEVGKSVYVEMFDSKKLYSVEVQVLKKEVLTTPLGKFRTILIKPVMKSEGIFYRKGDMLIWLTDDAARVPVLMTTKVPVGSIKATLVGGKY